ncbi:arylsulfatase [Halioxenophilus sp. WMMB6]|uniref:arylsulfatase n=1 Tax=Halioxenophilus sp. WMMB6 TaxID=3073815 RepID=UPI00295E270A|nr:arylsulfatase [Halioxenophilus sp. WMMB6]
MAITPASQRPGLRATSTLIRLLAGLCLSSLAGSTLALNLEASSSDQAISNPGTPPKRTMAAPGSPNVLVWLMDDVGYGQVSAFGGLVDTPNIDRVAAMGLKYANFRATPVCSPSRAALLTGRNPHTVHVGGHAMGPRGLPGYDTLVPPEAGTVAENFRQAGYRTFALGKWDHAPITDLTLAGPFDYWPEQQGFNRFYGFLTADTDNWFPLLWDGNTPVPTPRSAGYHLNRDLADKAIQFIEDRSGVQPPPPFFMYWATGTAHAPHHAPAEWIAKYKGRFDEGWDVAREKILAHQIELGILPAGTQLPPRPAQMPAWNELTPDAQKLYARQMEVFAAALAYADHEFGRLLDALAARGELDNTLVVVTSDNGASAEGGPNGLANEISFPNSHTPAVADNLTHYSQWGGPQTYPHYAFGWAVAGNTPFNYYKQTAYEGGIHVPMVMAWPKGISARGEWRNQFAYIADIAPTALAAAGVPLAATVNDVPQSPMDGKSLVASFDQPEQDESRAQYFEMYGNRSLVADNWKIVASDRTATWDLTTSASIDNPWALYDLSNDPGETTDLAASRPDKVAELDKLFRAQAAQFNVDPIDGGGGTRVYMGMLVKADFMNRRGQWRYPEPSARILEFNAPPIKFMSHTLTADVTLASGKESGVIYVMGSSLGGMGLYLKQGKPVFLLRGISGEEVRVASKRRLKAGNNALKLRFEYLNRQPGQMMPPLAPSDIRLTLTNNDEALFSETVNFPMPGTFSSTESFDIGRDDGKPLSDDYPSEADFPGEIRNIVFDFRPPQMMQNAAQ